MINAYRSTQPVLWLLLLLNSLFAAANAKQIALADPSIYPYQDKYYLIGTEAPPQQGFQAYVSDDLTHWQVARGDNGYILTRSASNFGNEKFWAPQLFQANGQIYFAYTANEQIAISNGVAPIGPFTQKKVASLGNGHRQIDPFVFIDDDGKAYLYHVRLNKGNHIYVAELNAAMDGIKPATLTHCLTAQADTWERTAAVPRASVVEGPSVVKHKGKYYLFYSANHFKSSDYAVGYAVADSPLGPWKRSTQNPILHQRHTHKKGSGHGDIFKDINNNWFYVFHTHASDTQVHPRKTWLAPLKWQSMETGNDTVSIDASAMQPLLLSVPG